MGPGAEPQRTIEEREAELDRREAALSIREDALNQRMEAAHEVLAAADRRDAIADARDTGAEDRDRHVDRAAFLATDDEYGDQYAAHLPQRRDAALDREHAKGNRTASQGDRIALTDDLGQAGQAEQS